MAIQPILAKRSVFIVSIALAKSSQTKVSSVGSGVKIGNKISHFQSILCHYGVL